MKNKNTKLKNRIFGKDSNNGVCERCKNEFPKCKLTVHHIIPQRHVKRHVLLVNNEYSMNKHQQYSILCRRCHDYVERQYNQLSGENTITNIWQLCDKAYNSDLTSKQKKKMLYYSDKFNVPGLLGQDIKQYENYMLNFIEIFKTLI